MDPPDRRRRVRVAGGRLVAPIPAGTSDGVGSLAYVDVVMPVGAAVGTFTASMWATDGTTRQAVPITIVVNATNCRHY